MNLEMRNTLSGFMFETIDWLIIPLDTNNYQLHFQGKG